jgi:nicotinic acid mononucleotide adenylyltransferase
MKKIVFTFGRMNPPTIGHEKLVKKVQDVAKSESADARVYLSHTQNSKNKKDPLSYKDKIRLAKKAFGSIMQESDSKTLIQIIKEIEQSGYTDIVAVFGGDRIKEMETLIKKYNGKDYNFDSIKVVSAGERDADSVDPNIKKKKKHVTKVSEMSASAMRELAKEGQIDDYEEDGKKYIGFRKGLPKNLQRDAESIAKSIVSNLSEEVEMEEQRAPLTIAQRNAKARLMKRLAPKIARFRKMKAKRMADRDAIMKRAQKAARNVIRKKVAGEKGSDYSALSASEKISIDKLVAKKSAIIKKLAKKLLPKVRKAELERLKRARGGGSDQNESYGEWTDADFNTLVEETFLMIEKEEKEAPKKTPQDRDVKDIEGTQPKKYYKGLSKDDKEARAKQFAKGADKPDDSPSSYKPAPGDDAETKPSKHTLKYKKMFGEGEATKLAKVIIKREKEADKVKHDRMLDQARTQDTRTKNAQTKPQTEEYELSEDASASLKKKSEKSGIPVGILRQVYNRGMAAWKTGHRPGATQQQWGFARVNSFITKGKGTWGAADSDLASKVRGTKKESLGEAIPYPGKQRGDHAVSPKLAKIIHNFDLILAGEKEVAKVLRQAKLNKDDLDYALRFFSKELDGKLIKKHLGLKEEVELDEKCWDTHKQVGMKMKDGKQVPNCVQESASLNIKNIDAFRDALEKAKIPHRVFQRGTGDRRQYKIYMDKQYHKQATKLFNKIDVREAVSPAQQAAIAISKKERGEKPKKEEDFQPHMMYDPNGEDKELAKIPADHERLSKKGWTHEPPKKKKLSAMLGVPTARPVVPMGEEIELNELPNWLSVPLSKVVHKKGYDKAKELLQMVVDRKKKDKSVRHDMEYYAAQIAKQFDGVDARTLAKMVSEEPEKMDAPQIGTDAIRKRYADMTPGQIDESFQTPKSAGTGHTMFASEFMKIQGAYEHHPDVEEELERRAMEEDYLGWNDELVEENEYQGRKVKLNDPFRTPKGPKKFSVYVKNDKGNVVKVNFGDPNMEIKRDDPERRKNFRARHNCDQQTDKTKAGYWSCRMWAKGQTVSDLD